MTCKVLLPDRSFKPVFINSFTTVREALADTATRVGLTLHTKYFSLFEVDEHLGVCICHYRLDEILIPFISFLPTSLGSTICL